MLQNKKFVVERKNSALQWSIMWWDDALRLFSVSQIISLGSRMKSDSYGFQTIRCHFVLNWTKITIFWRFFFPRVKDDIEDAIYMFKLHFKSVCITYIYNKSKRRKRLIRATRLSTFSLKNRLVHERHLLVTSPVVPW